MDVGDWLRSLGFGQIRSRFRENAIDGSHRSTRRRRLRTMLKELSDVHFPDAEQIRLVQDNLSTDTPASLYATFPAPEARRLFDTLRARLFRKAGGCRTLAARLADTETSRPRNRQEDFCSHLHNRDRIIPKLGRRKEIQKTLQSQRCGPTMTRGSTQR
jgi:SAM domain (Sterile alpha motif)